MAKILKRLFGAKVDAREATFAGLMYPEDADELENLLESALRGAESSQSWRAAIVPHSDLEMTSEFSAHIWTDLPDVERLIVVAPALRVPFRGVGVSSKEALETPLGPLGIDHEDYRPLEGSSIVRMQDDAHRVEPGIELQLPWIAHLSPDTRVIPLLVGDGPADDVAWVLDRLWNEDTAIVLACELSADLNRRQAEKLDSETVAKIEGLEPGGFEFGQVTARKPLEALIRLISDRRLTLRKSLRTHSGELGGPTERVQGFAAISFG